MNDLKRDHTAASQELKKRETAFAEFKILPVGQEILTSIRIRCASLAIPLPENLEEALSPSWTHKLPVQSEALQRAHRLASTRASLPVITGDLNDGPLNRWNEALASSDASAQLGLNFYSAADEYVRSTVPSAECPLCGQHVRSEELAGRIQRAIREIGGATKRLQAAKEPAAALLVAVQGFGRDATSAVARAAQLLVRLDPPPASTNVDEGIAALSHRSEVLWAPIATYLQAMSEWVASASSQLEAAIPSSGAQRDQTMLELGLLLSTARDWNLAKASMVQARATAERAAAVFDSYQEEQAGHLTRILERISLRVAEIYTKLHPHEDLTEAKIIRSADKGVELSVNFHGTDQSPPHGVLSESHLNSLAIALFLAMAETFSTELGFIVLDDVVNSFDSEHRAQLARVLVEDFSDRQLLVLTHDPLFYDRIRRHSRGWGFAEFTSWTFSEGPRMAGYATSALLAKAQAALPDDRVAAAQKGRRALEELLQEICEGLGGQVEFRRGAKNDRREIGELLPSLRHVIRTQDPSAYKVLSGAMTDIEADVATTLNIEAHASMASASSAEITQALVRIEALEAVWTCSACSTRVWDSGTPESCHCRCNSLGFPGRLDLTQLTPASV
jgi:hypothetical protein